MIDNQCAGLLAPSDWMVVKGLIAWGEEKTFSWVEKKMDELYENYKEDRYRCSSLVRKWSNLIK